MGRFKSHTEEKHAAAQPTGVQAKAISGTSTVLLVWDMPSARERQHLAGFAIKKLTGSTWQWLQSGGRRFKKDVAKSAIEDLEKKLAALDLESEEAEESLQKVAASAGTADIAADEGAVTMCEAPIQSFQWSDYSCQAGELYKYSICPVYFSAGAADSSASLKVSEELAAVLAVKMECNSPAQQHEVFFNRGVGGSQAYSRKFGALAPSEAGPEAFSWLSNGLSEALLGFIDRASGQGWSIRAAFYEFTWQPALEAFAKAAERGVDVSIVVDCGSNAPREKVTQDMSSLPTSGRIDLQVPFRQKDDAKALGAKWDGELKVWYAPNAERALVERWGPHLSTSSKGRLMCDVCIDEVPGLRKLIVRRERCKAISHNKLIVLIPPKSKAASVWTGSTNLTESGIFGQANVAHVVNDECIAEEYLAYWQCLADDMPTDECSERNASCISDDELPKPSTSVELCDKTNLVTCPRPSLKLLDRYADYLASAKKSACVTFAFTVDKGLGAILEADSQTTRHVLLEKRSKSHEAICKNPANRVASGAVLGEEQLREGLESDGQEHLQPERLTGLNEHVHYVHTKFMLVDPLGSRPTTISGSANFSQASVRRNDENMLFIQGSTRVADMYFVEFWRLFQHWCFRDKVSQRMWDRRNASRDGDKMPSLVKLHLAEDDSWLRPFYDKDHAKFREHEMLMAMHVEDTVSEACPSGHKAAAPDKKQGCTAS